jgi:O-antigen ligase
MTRTAWSLACAGAALLLLPFYLHPIGITASALLAALVVASASRPYESLQAVAALLPLSTILFVLLRIDAGGWRLIEAMSLAFVAGASFRFSVSRAPGEVPTALAWTTVALITAVVASGVVSTWVTLTQEFAVVTAGAIGERLHSYPIHVDPTTFAGQSAVGLLLFLTTIAICRNAPDRVDGVVKMLVLGATGAGLVNILRIVIDGALTKENPLASLVELLVHLRVNVHHGDLNAAGSYFALALFLAFASAFRRPAMTGASTLVIAMALWIAGSRVGLAATIIVGTLWAAAWLRHRVNQRAAVAALLLMAAGVVIVVSQSPFDRHVADPSLALRIRMGLAEGALRMAWDHPFFGVGVGHFYEQSRTYVDVLNYIVRENAHNNFLQVLAELGVPGLLLFLTLVGISIAAAWRQGGWTLTCVLAGLCAYLLTALGGHPLLVPHSALPFWIALGLAASSYAGVPRLPVVRITAMALTVVYVVTVPWRTIDAAARADLEHTSTGFSVWQQEEGSGRRYRYAGGRSTFFVPSSARAVSFEVRRGALASEPLEVRIFLDGREGHRVTVRSSEWTPIRLPLVNRQNAFTRMDIEAGVPGSLRPLETDATSEGGLIDVGRPVIEP